MPLVIYKSSAGSGKTTTLVNEYLKITLKNPAVFRHVLAITFTNKAANEMKSRIIEALEKMISGQAWGEGKYQSLFSALKMDKDTVCQQSQQLLTRIIHNYDEFSISTIDAFVHRIIRTFATDVKLPQNFEVLIDKDDIVPEIVAGLFDKVGSDKALTDIMINFVLSRAEEEKGHDPGRPVREFVEKQLNEDGFQWLQKISDLTPDDLLRIIRQIRENIRNLRRTIREKAQKAVDLINDKYLDVSDFYHGKSGIGAYFARCAVFDDDNRLSLNSYITSTIDEDKWTSTKAGAAAKAAIEEIKDDLKHYFEIIENVKNNYFLFKTVYKKIYALALANEIRSLFIDFTSRTQKVHISEFNKRISREIAGQPVPFIYERLGRHYRYFLIDEFQDTSVLQWHNLLPLFEESLANGYFNMLVGDAKQAIYRFRNGEVELFTSLPKIYGHDGSALMKQREKQLEANHKIVDIKENWRSREEIIRFNNRFFDSVKNSSGDMVKQIYEGHRQTVPVKKDNQGGYVSLEFIEAENADNYKEKRLDYILKYVNELKKNDYQNKDICVLSGTNKNAIQVASFLLRNGFSVISPESLLLINSPEVRLVIALLKLMLNPLSEIVMVEIARNWASIQQTTGDLHLLYKEFLDAMKQGMQAVFDNLGIQTRPEQILIRPVYEIVEIFIRELGMDRKVNIYLQYFLDFVFDAHEKGYSSIGTFIDLWEDKKEKAFITLSAGADAIQVMTIHKAKGLDFETVIVDISGGSNRNGKPEVWSEIDLPEVEGLKVALLPTDSSLVKAGFENLHIEEKNKTELDFVNMIYVAFTRAVSAMFIIGYESQKDKFTKKLTGFLTAENLLEPDKKQYEFGVLQKRSVPSNEDNEAPVVLKKMISSSWNKLIKVAPTEEIYWEAIDSKPERTYGNLVHAMLSGIYHEEDILKVVNAYRNAGIINDQEAGDVSQLISDVVMHENLNSLFQHDAVIKNEVDLVDINEENHQKSFRRPDRVVVKDGRLFVVDYKTGEKKPEHIRQLNRYADLFKQLGYQYVEKKLVYIGEAVEVIDL